MEVNLAKEREIIEEALEILAEHMEASKIAFLLSLLQSNKSNYLEMREQLFAGETVESLAQKVEDYQQSENPHENN